MTEKKNNFHEIAIKSSLFKGRTDWYFCYLKSERIAHVLVVLTEHAEINGHDFEALRDSASAVPVLVVQMASGRIAVKEVLSAIFSILSTIRLFSTRTLLTQETGRILLDEYEALAEKLETGMRVSPFVTAEDFAVPIAPQESKEVSRTLVSAHLTDMISLGTVAAPKDTNIGHKATSKGQTERSERILSFVRNNNSVSIKDVSAAIRGCSEKTIQRELSELIRQGLIRKVGERRWSQYQPV